MPVTVHVANVGTFKRRADRTAVIGGLPPLLNEDQSLRGKLREELDLNIGCEGYEDTRSRDLRFNSLIDYIRQTSRQGTPFKEAIGADFVANRKVLITIAQSPYRIEPRKIRAIRKKGVILMCDDRTDTYSCPSGFKFEQYLTLNEQGKPHDKRERLSSDGCTKLVLRTTLEQDAEKITVFYAAEVDAIDKTGTLVELKTTGLNQAKWLEVASLRTYLQSFLANVSYIIFGHKPSPTQMVVHTIDKVYTESIPRNRVNWKKEVCFEKLFEVLNQIKEKLPNDNDALILDVTREGIYFRPELAENCTFLDPSLLIHFQ